MFEKVNVNIVLVCNVSVQNMVVYGGNTHFCSGL